LSEYGTKNIGSGNNSELEDLLCQNNQLSSLDVSKNTKLVQLYCANNDFSTEKIDKIFCSLPVRNPTNKPGRITPLFNTKGSASAKVLATNKNNATKKLWCVLHTMTKRFRQQQGNIRVMVRIRPPLFLKPFGQK
jgi:cell wall surface anchor family protein